MVFEVRGAIQNFAVAAGKIGIDLIDEEELDEDSEDKAPVAYLLFPDVRAFDNMQSLWKRWLAGESLSPVAWNEFFSLLRDLRPWGPDDRLSKEDQSFLQEEIEGRSDEDLVSLEIDLVFQKHEKAAQQRERSFLTDVQAAGGRKLNRSYIGDIAYHAVLIELPVRSVREIAARSPSSVIGHSAVMHIRPQSVSSLLDVADTEQSLPSVDGAPEKSPILGLLDGVPVARHPLLSDRVVVSDVFDLETGSEAAHRVHGTAMASLIVHGDRNRSESHLDRKIHIVPVLAWNGVEEGFPKGRLIVDVIYEAVRSMREGKDAEAPDVLIVNLSLGNSRRPFHGQMSPWARVLDRLAWRYGVLFVVSAGNATKSFPLESFSRMLDFEDADFNSRATGILVAVNERAAERRLFSPAETLNGLTVGSLNQDAVPDHQRRTVTRTVEPFAGYTMSNPSSCLGPGFARSVKPDILMPGAREHLRAVGGAEGVLVQPMGPTRAFGLKVAAPPTAENEAAEGFTNGTSAAAALASRTCHRIHDALEAAYGEAFTGLRHIQRAVLLKALVVHPAQWPKETAEFIKGNLGPTGKGQTSKQKDNIRRFLGYGALDADDAVACAADRATFWAVGVLGREQSALVDVPIPACIGGQARLHGLSATLAWFTPVQSGRRSYRAVRLNLLAPENIDTLAIKPSKAQPDHNQIRRGTVLSRHWDGERPPLVSKDMTIRLIVQRELDQGAPVDERVPFGLAVTLSMPGVNEIYEQVRQRLQLETRAPIR